MRFISPKTDFAFKKIFGSEESKNILISFLNAILYAEQDIIEDIEIVDPYLVPKIRGMKDTYLDVRAKLADQTTVIIEMQVLNVEGFEKRILYNAAKAYSMQLKEGQTYTLLNPVIALTITDFVMFKSIESLLTRFILKERKYLVDYPLYDLELVFVELPKFNKPLEALEGITDKWLFFLKSANEMSVIPPNMSKISSLRQAFELANRANLTLEELDKLERREIYLQDWKGGISKAKREAREQGLQEGRQEGRQEQMLEIAKNLLDILDDETISQRTGLSLDEVKKLRG